MPLFWEQPYLQDESQDSSSVYISYSKSGMLGGVLAGRDTGGRRLRTQERKYNSIESYELMKDDSPNSSYL